MKNDFYPTTSLFPCTLFRHGLLEFGCKILHQKDDAYVSALFLEIFRSYRNLLKDCEDITLINWISDGTELLVYDRNPDRTIAWSRWQGFAKAHKAADGSLPVPPICYTDHPVELTYGDLKRIIAIVKKCCFDVLGKTPNFVLPFDPGSEFNEAPFRYEQHTEILLHNDHSWIHCIDAIGRFHADSIPYAGYPKGIPEGTPFGEFFGRQAQAYLTDMGADGLWFSNSFGFGRSPYAYGGTGQFFDGKSFTPEGNRAVRDSVIEFWSLFRQECPSIPIYCRGTDFPVGVNLVNHATAYAAVYDQNRYNIVPPPNTPWPALTHNHGLALAGFMTQNAPFPGERLPLRFYTTDQWFCNNPWFDRWDRSPHDIYLSASLCKLSPQGAVCAIDSVHVMGVDGSWGETVAEVADEVVPHLKRAAVFKPDALPPLLWVYPFDEYNEMVFGDNPHLEQPFGGDLSIIGALNHGFPIGGIVTTANLAATRAAHGDAFRSTLLVTPPPTPGSAWETLLLEHLNAGGKVLCYGSLSLASKAWLERLGMTASEAPLEGELEVALPAAIDAASNRYFHDPAVCQGPLVENPTTATILVSAFQDGQRRALVTMNDGCAWVRGGSSVSPEGLLRRAMNVRPEDEWFAPESLFVAALWALGWTALPKNGLLRKNIHFELSRCRNGFMATGYSPDDEATLRLSTPWGAPVPLARNVRIENSVATLPVRQWFHDELRVFVKQDSGVVGCHSQPVVKKDLHRRWYISGLHNATVRFYTEPGCHTVYYLTESPEFGHSREPILPTLQNDATGTYFELHNHSGDLSIGWGATE